MRQYYVYILASRPGGTLYVGVTGDLVRRVYQHKEGLIEGFTKRYRIHRLVYFEVYPSIHDALQREKEYEALAPCLEDQAHHSIKSDLARSSQ